MHLEQATSEPIKSEDHLRRPVPLPDWCIGPLWAHSLPSQCASLSLSLSLPRILLLSLLLPLSSCLLHSFVVNLNPCGCLHHLHDEPKNRKTTYALLHQLGDNLFVYSSRAECLGVSQATLLQCVIGVFASEASVRESSCNSCRTRCVSGSCQFISCRSLLKIL